MTSGHSAAITSAGGYRRACRRTRPHGRAEVEQGRGQAAVLRRWRIEAAALPLVEAAPHALLLAGGDRVLEAGLAHRADRADRLAASAAVVGLDGG